MVCKIVVGSIANGGLSWSLRHGSEEEGSGTIFLGFSALHPTSSCYLRVKTIFPKVGLVYGHFSLSIITSAYTRASPGQLCE